MQSGQKKKVQVAALSRIRDRGRKIRGQFEEFESGGMFEIFSAWRQRYQCIRILDISYVSNIVSVVPQNLEACS